MIKRINKVAYKFALLDHWKIHNVFCIIFLPESIDTMMEDPPKVDELEEILWPQQIVFMKRRSFFTGTCNG